MKVFAGMDPHLPISEVGSYAARVERLGYDGLHVAEMVHDPFVAAALAAQATSRLTIRTAVALAFVRSPMATALSAWELGHLSGGRFQLGLGTQIRANIEDRYGMEFDRPVARLRDHVDAIRACFDAFETGAELHHQGPFHQLTRLQPDFRPEPLESARPVVWMGAVGEQMLRLAGEIADGLITHPTNSHPVDLSERMLPRLGEGAARVPRPAPAVVVSPMTITGPDSASVDQGKDVARRRLAFLYSTPAYRPTLELLGFADLGSRLRDLTRAEAWADLADLLPDAVLEQVVPVAPWPELPAVLLDRYESLADGVVVRPPDDEALDVDFAAVVSALAES